MNMSHFNQNRNKHHSGFTLVEFIVIMAIFAVMVGVVLFNFTGFRSKITLDNLAQDIALSIRQIQVSAGASLSDPARPEDENPRGIYFPVDGGSYARYFILFEDADESGTYEENGEDIIIDTITIQAPDPITAIYYGDSIDFAENELSRDPFAITFKRFRTDALFSDPQGLTTNAGVVRIQITSIDGDQARLITVSKLGQVSVQSVSLSVVAPTPIIPDPNAVQ